MTLKSDTQFGEESICRLHEDSWQILKWALESLETFHFNGLLLA